MADRRKPVTRIVLGAGVRLYREGLAAELRTRDGFMLVGLGGDFNELIGAVRATQPDVVLLDLGMPDTVALVRETKASCPQTHVVAFAVDESEHDIELCAEAGVTGFVTRDVTVDGLAAAIDAAARGELACSPRTAALLFRRVAALSSVGRAIQSATSSLARLTSREKQIVRLIDTGSSNKEIGRELNIAVATVKNHVHRILEKLNVTSRAEAAAHVRVYAKRAD